MTQVRSQDALEAQVRAARERGELDDLPGRGKPLQLDEFDHLPSEKRFAALLMRSMRELPVALALVREIRAFRELIEHCHSDAEREQLRSKVQQKLMELDAALKLERLEGKQR